MEDNTTPEINKVELELQDIIQIAAPDNDLLNDKMFIISYISSDTTLSGIGFVVNFNAALLTHSSTTNVYSSNVVDSGTLNNTSDGVSFGWADLGGNWPGSSPRELATLTFDISENATGGSTFINFTSTDVAAGYSFSGQTQEITNLLRSTATHLGTFKVLADSCKDKK